MRQVESAAVKRKQTNQLGEPFWTAVEDEGTQVFLWLFQNQF